MSEVPPPGDDAPREHDTFARGSKLFHIYEEDLAVLEKALPEISSCLMGHDNPRVRTALRRVKAILSDVRWDYGPHGQVEIIRCDDIPPGADPPDDPQGVC